MQNVLRRAVVVLIIVLGQVLLNLHLVFDPGSFCESRVLQPVINGFVWVAFNTLLCLLCIESHRTNLLKNEDRSDGTVSDKSLWYHWPKLFIWLPGTAIVLWISGMGIEDGHTIHTTVLSGGSCTWGADLECEISPTLYLATIATFISSSLYFALYFFYLMRAWRQLSSQLYQKYRILNLAVRLQFRFNGTMVLSLIFGIAMTWYLGSDACVNFAVTWYGNPPVTFIIVCFQLVSFNLTFPRRYNAINTQHVLPTTLLQQFAWTEADVPRKLASRAAAVDASCTSVCPGLLAKPLFCFETAIKLFFWSVLVYSYTETAGVPFETMPGPIKALIGEMDAAMRLFNLSKRHLFYDRALGTKVLVAWNSSTIVVTVRGTAEMANFLQDAKFLQTAHPPKRKYKGRTPRVHKGFLATWQANGIRTRVLDHISQLLDSAEDRGAVRVLCTGHSLGGAVAQLASIDIARELGVGPRNIKAYTYGCPRLGNHALAEEVDEVVPDTWHIINDNDIVTRTMKFLGTYKRAGQRVIVNNRGHLIVRPSHLETSLLQRVWGGKAAHHKTVEYQSALVAIVMAQLQASSRHEDGLHGLLGLLKGVPQVRLALESHAASMGTSLVDLMHEIGHDLHPGGPSSPGPNSLGPANASMRHQMSLVRAAGGEANDDAAAAAPAHGSDAGSQALPHSGAAKPVILGVGDTDADEAAVDVLVVGPGDCRPAQDDDDGAAAAAMGRWRSATAVASLAAGLARGAAAAPRSMAAHAKPSVKRKGSAAATGASKDAGDGGSHAFNVTVVDGGAGGGEGGREAAPAWRSPRDVGAGPKPAGGRVHGDVVEMGAAPDMRGLQGGSPAAKPANAHGRLAG